MIENQSGNWYDYSLDPLNAVKNYTSTLRAWNEEGTILGARRRVLITTDPDALDLRGFWHEIEECPQLEFLLLAECPETWDDCLPAHWRDTWPGNVRLGFTAQDQRRWDQRYEAARAFGNRGLPFFVCCDPLVGRIEFMPATGLVPPEVGWVIVAGESGPNARLMCRPWVESIRDQCQDSGTPFFFKWWGDWFQNNLKGVVRIKGYWHSGFPHGGDLLAGKRFKEFPDFA